MQYTVITGASKGIGKAITELCAEKGMNLLLIARSENLLVQLRDQLKKFGVDIHILALDLFDSSAAQVVFDYAAQHKLSINMLVNNAGMGLYGKFDGTAIERHIQVMHLNMDACVRMAHAFLRHSDPNQKRYLLNVVSMAAYQPVPNMSIYAATKAFMLYFSRGIRDEVNGLNVHVTALCPGGTETDFFGPAQMEEVVKKNARFMMKASDVAKAGLEGVLKNKSVVIPGFTNKANALVSKLFPHDVVVPVAGKIFET